MTGVVLIVVAAFTVIGEWLRRREVRAKMAKLKQLTDRLGNNWEIESVDRDLYMVPKHARLVARFDGLQGVMEVDL